MLSKNIIRTEYKYGYLFIWSSQKIVFLKSYVTSYFEFFRSTYWVVHVVTVV